MGSTQSLSFLTQEVGTDLTLSRKRGGAGVELMEVAGVNAGSAHLHGPPHT
jgi:hypothetical protein